MANAGTAFLTLSPLLVGGMVDYLHVTNEQAGLLAAAHLAGAAVGSFTCMLMVNQVGQQRIIVLAVVCLIIGELLFLYIGLLPGMLLGRLLAGLGAGIIFTVAAANVVSLKRKDAVYAFLLLGQMIYGFIGVTCWPLVLESVGYRLAMLSLPLLGILILPFLKMLPAVTTSAQTKPTVIAMPSMIGIFVLMSLFLHYVANSTEWVYLERIGVEGGLTVETVSSALGVTMIFGIIGTLLAIVVGQLGSRFIPITVSILGIIFGTGMLLTQFNAMTYTVSISIILMTMVFVVPFYQGFIADLENGKMMAMLGAGAINVGLAIGPMIGSQIVSLSGFQAMLYFCIVVFVCSLILICMGFYRQHQTQ